ncbi:uncharacterized protein [Dermacentor andersoni]|uniref:uncharacterized protein isoform X2 n=1 Tax=Dermacentor andersoni TaxID=34620 RepID=UPI003B3B888C
MPPAKKKRTDKECDWKQWCRRKCSIRLVLGYVAPLLLTPAAVANSNMGWCLSVGLLMVAWTLLGTVPVPITWLLPFFVLPLAGVTSVSDLADMFMEDSLVILLLGMNLLVAAGEETALCSRVALYVIEAFGLRLRGILLGITGVTFLSAQLLMGGSATLLMCAVVEATMFELQHDLIAATIAHGRRRNVRTTVGEDVVMTPVHVMVISPRKTPPSGSSPDDYDEDDDDMDESSEDDDEGDLRPRVLVPSIAPFDARNPGAFYQLHGTVPDDPRYIVGMDAVIPEIDQNEDPQAPKKSPILKHRNTAKMFLLEAHRFHKIKKALLINVAHTSAVGCMASILGSTSGIYLRDYFHFTYGYDAVTALSWTLLGLPVATVSVLLCAFITYFLFLRAYDIQEDGDTLKVISEIIKKKRKFLGKLTYAHESVNVMAVVVLLSFLPHGHRTGSVLDWHTVSGRISWRALLSVGGGLSLAGAVESTGLSRRITEKLSSLDFLSPLQTQVVLIVLTTLLAEVNTNVVIARFLIPIASDIGVLTNVHPLYYALPVAMASCTPTLLPTSAPSIAVVTSAMDIQVVDIASINTSIIAQWDLVCHRRWILIAMTASYMGSAAVLMPLTGVAADRVGRAPVLAVALLVLIVAGTTLAFATTLLVFAILRVLISVSVGTLVVVSSVLLFEVTDSTRRVLYSSVAIAGGVSAANVYCEIMYELADEWALIQMINMLPSTLLIGAVYIVQESPNWLLATHRFGLLCKMVMSAAQTNGADLKHVAKRLEVIRKEDRRPRRESLDEGLNEASPLEVLTNPLFRPGTLVAYGCWILAMSLFHQLRGSQEARSVYYGQIALECPAVTVNIFLLQRKGRRIATAISMIALGFLVAALGAFCFILPDPSGDDGLARHLETAVRVAALLAVDSVVVSLSVITVEMYPTVLRVGGLAFAYGGGRLGAIAATFASSGSRLGRGVELVVVSLLLVAFGALALVVMPETTKIHATNMSPVVDARTAERDKWMLDAPLRLARGRRASSMVPLRRKSLAASLSTFAKQP